MAGSGSRIPAKYRQIADRLRADITEGRLKPGDQLPSQQDLVDEYGVVMATVVRALDELRREGLVETRHGLGTFVRKQEPSAEYLAVMGQLDDLTEQVRQLREKVERIEAQQGRQRGE